LIGGVTVFALPPDMPLYVDERIIGLDWLILGGGSRSTKIRTSPEVFRGCRTRRWCRASPPHQMPELPEVEAARRVAERVARGRRIVDVWCADDPIVFERIPATRWRRALLGRRVAR